jgi:hypothetical protein
MGLIGKLAKITYDITTSPIAIVKDVITLGGAITDSKSAIVEKIEQIQEDSDEIRNEL